MTEEERDAQIELAKKLLAEAGFTLTVVACGCCDSPWVRLTHNGVEVIVDKTIPESSRGLTVSNAEICMHEIFGEIE